MYHGIKYKGLRYKLFSFRWKRKIAIGRIARKNARQ